MRKTWGRQVAMYKAKRYANGIEKCQAYMAQKFDICDVPDAKNISREISLMRRRLEQESIFAGNSGQISVLIVLDFSIDHGSGAMSALKPISRASSVRGQLLGAGQPASPQELQASLEAQGRAHSGGQTVDAWAELGT